MREMRNAYTNLVGDPKGKRPLERPRCSWEDNIKMILYEAAQQPVYWIHLAQDRNKCQALVNTVMRVWVS
jgi:hypothetical protein